MRFDYLTVAFVSQAALWSFNNALLTTSLSTRKRHLNLSLESLQDSSIENIITSTEGDLQSPLSSLPLPPQKGGILRRFRDTFSHLQDPERFIERRSAELGPVFQMYQFFKPVVVVGGQDAVKEFIQEREAEAKVIYPDLPETFRELQTEWSTLNMDSTQQRFKEARELFKDMLQAPEARSYYLSTILPEIEAYADSLLERVQANPQKEILLVPELKELCLQIFARIFSGEGLTKEQVQMFLDYNSSLLTISKVTPEFKKGKEALDTLSEVMLRRFHAMEDKVAQGERIFVFECFRKNKGFLDVKNYERISVGMLLMIWGAYIECAALMIGSTVCMLEQNIDPTATVLREIRDQEAKGEKRTELSFWDGMKYTNGIMKESLRLVPPGAGLSRYGDTEFSLAGYRIPKGLSVQLDPRIGNKDSSLFEQAESFEPLRWVPPGASTTPASSSCPFKGMALTLGTGSWFPGGNGAHRCPGVPLAELVSTMFVSALSERFDSWEFGGSGLTTDGAVNYVNIPIKISPDDLGLKFCIRQNT
ncbi:cytochrome P450 [Nitzschia inconspicua]|uniref:Cytochrome P450 n=1 Tax=Nitzschia inconspicua TaxID=303405 RepID=A0A9K3M341_9STRA|nr:cytochrome P450 [Nitzschia inconspicua]